VIERKTFDFLYSEKGKRHMPCNTKNEDNRKLISQQDGHSTKMDGTQGKGRAARSLPLLGEKKR